MAYLELRLWCRSFFAFAAPRGLQLGFGAGPFVFIFVVRWADTVFGIVFVVRGFFAIAFRFFNRPGLLCR